MSGRPPNPRGRRRALEPRRHAPLGLSLRVPRLGEPAPRPARPLLALAAGLALGLPAGSRAESDGQAGLGFEALLVDGKYIAGPQLAVDVGALGICTEAELIFLDEAAPEAGLDGTFVGALLGLHLHGDVLALRGVTLRVGTGLDLWSLFAIHGDEWKIGWPIFVEGEATLGSTWSVYLQPRYYLLASDGLEPGRNRAGESEGAPLVLAAGLRAML